ncbi:MAG TPA: HlyD family efflux transporter periplasmic adaptor subunit [Bryobacteraceae bacterium]|nr:HlyD family efflux transporter periplasmic adaptor subunit [Bryobacteraceae bacterium]
MPEPRRRGKLWAVLVGAAAVAGLAYYLRLQTAGPATPLVTVPTAAVQRGDVQNVLRVSGTLAAKEQIAILGPRIQGSRTDVGRGGSANMLTTRQAFTVGGGGGGPAGFGAAQANDFSLVLTKLAEPGTHVKKGDVIVQFDTLLQQQRLDDYKDSLVQLDANIKNRMASMGSQKESHLQQVRAAKAAWQNAMLNQQTNEVVSSINAQLNDVATEQAKDQYEQLVYEDDLLDQQQRAEVQAIELNRDQSQLELQRSEANIKKMSMEAPMDGFVVMATLVRNGEFGTVRVGDQVRPGQPIMYIENPASMVVNADLNQVDSQSVKIGMKAIVRLDAYENLELPATLTGVGAMAKDSTFRADWVSVVPLELRLDKTDPRVIPDLTASADITLQSEPDTLFVPRSALFQDNGKPFVYVQDSSSPTGWTRKNVEIGVKSATRVAIRSGLTLGELVATRKPSQT